MAFVLSILSVIASPPVGLAASFKLHTYTRIAARDYSDLEEVVWSRPPALHDMKDISRVIEENDMFAVILCKGLRADGRLQSCRFENWRYRRADLDKLAMAAVLGARVSPEQVGRMKPLDVVNIAVRFGTSRALPIKPCPSLVCSVTVPPPPPGPSKPVG